MQKLFDLIKSIFLLCITGCICVVFAMPVNLHLQQKLIKASVDSEKVITNAEEFEDAVKEAFDGDILLVSGEITLSDTVVLQKNITIKKAEAADIAVFKLSETPLNAGRHFAVATEIEAAFINIGFKGHGDLSYSKEGDNPKGGGIEVREKSKLNLTGCSFWGNSYRFGGGVGMDEGGYLTIDKCSFMYNRAQYGGGVYAAGRYPYAEDEDEDSPTYGSEIYISDRLGFATVTDSIIENNYAEYYGGGIVFDDYSEGEVRNCVISNNTVTRGSYFTSGGGIAVGVAGISIINCIINNNTAENGGGLYFAHREFDTMHTSVVANCIIFKNTAYGNGGGIYAHEKSAVLFYGCSIYENGAESGGGAYIGELNFAGTGANAVFVFCTIASNTSTTEGNGMFIINAFVSVFGTIIADNSVAGKDLPDNFTISADSIYPGANGDIFEGAGWDSGQIKIKPYSLAHNKISCEDVLEWLDNEVLEPISEYLEKRVMYGNAYEVGAFELPEYNVIFMSFESIYAEAVYCDGELVIVPQQPVREGYIFKGWYTDSAFTEVYHESPVSGDLKIYAKWDELPVPAAPSEPSAPTAPPAPPAPFPWIMILSICGGIFLFAALFVFIYIAAYRKRVQALAKSVNVKNITEISYPELDVLTPREMEVFKLLIAGNTLRQIQGELKIAYETVHFHYKNIYKKLKVNSRVELIKKYKQ